MTDNQKLEIDIVNIIKTIWLQRATIIKSTSIVFILFLIYVLIVPSRYAVSTVLLPQTNQQRSIPGGLGGLASLAGVDVSDFNQSTDIPADIYPRIAASIPFNQALLQTRVNSKYHSHPLLLKDYLLLTTQKGVYNQMLKYTIGLPRQVLKWLKGSDGEEAEKNLGSNSQGFIKLSKEDEELIRLLKTKVYLFYDEEDGTVTINSTLPEALPAAQIALKAKELLVQSIRDFKTQKANEELRFIEKLYEEKEQDFEQIQLEIARFKDSNQVIKTSIARNELVQLETRYSLAFNAYNDIAIQLESAKIKMRMEMPSFTTLEPVSIPSERTFPKRTLTMILSLFIGIFIGLLVIFSKEFFAYIQIRWN